jgi:hypothetical protein
MNSNTSWLPADVKVVQPPVIHSTVGVVGRPTQMGGPAVLGLDWGLWGSDEACEPTPRLNSAR